MLHQILIIQRSTGVLLYQKDISKEFTEMESTLISGMLTAMQELAGELKIGQLTTFNAMKNKILLSASQQVTCGLILDPEDLEEEWRNKAQKIGETFESTFDLATWTFETEVFLPFNKIIENLLKDLEWKESPIDFKFEENLLIGLFIYDKNKRIYYKRFLEDFEVSSLLQMAQATIEPEFQIVKDKKSFFIYKTPYGGLIAAFDIRIPSDKMKRMIKTLKFCSEHLQEGYELAPTFKKYIQNYVDKNTVKNVEKEVRQPLLKILASRKDAFDLIEELRKIKLRELINLVNI
ncbi:MAG: hypothetical protein EAX96_17540 [Candidatus Lokiarchaeota archaeon]|nr:hypothetical protein [Candidatus Lokiarchaeota archaeon]